MATLHEFKVEAEDDAPELVEELVELEPEEPPVDALPVVDVSALGAVPEAVVVPRVGMENDVANGVAVAVAVAVVEDDDVVPVLTATELAVGAIVATGAAVAVLVEPLLLVLLAPVLAVVEVPAVDVVPVVLELEPVLVAVDVPLPVRTPESELLVVAPD